MTNPARAGPTARAEFALMAFKATADRKSAGGTSSGKVACQAGEFMAAPTPIANVNANKTQEVDIPASVKTPSKQAASSIHPWVKRSRRRRSTMSARAPAGSESKKAGKLVADWINATISGEAETELISQAAPTFCIQVPIFDAEEAIHILRKTGWCSGLQAEAGFGVSASETGSGGKSVGVLWVGTTALG